MSLEEKSAIVALLKEFRDVFAWSYEGMRGLDPQLYQHQIHLSKDAKLVAQRRYQMKPSYAAKVKEEIDKLLRVGFMRPVRQAAWLSPIVVVPKKNSKIRVYRLLEIKCRNSHGRVSTSVYGWRPGRGSRP